jgi:hypothetical protein
MLNVTQTEAVMSKTVKRVMTVMMIGLVALLGAGAEAHTRWINGKPRVCSICSGPEDTMLEEVPADLINPKIPAPAVAELIVKTNEVTITCSDNTKVKLKGKKDEAILIAETPSNLWAYDPTTKIARVRFFVSDELFEILGFCGVAKIIDVQILKMSAKYKASGCTDSGCSSRVRLSTMTLNDCKVPPDAAPGTLYDCKRPKIEHVHPTPPSKGMAGPPNEAVAGHVQYHE